MRIDIRPARKALKELAEQGSAEAMGCLGDSYGLREYGSVDLTEAEYWYRCAADQGSAGYRYLLGLVLRALGRHDESREAFVIASELGVAPAAHILGRLYMDGPGVPRDFVVAERILQRASDLGSVPAKIMLGKLLVIGAFGVGAKLRGAWLAVHGLFQLIAVAVRRDDTRGRLDTGGMPLWGPRFGDFLILAFSLLFFGVGLGLNWLSLLFESRLAFFVFGILMLLPILAGFVLLRGLWEKSERWIFVIVPMAVVPIYSALDTLIHFVFGGRVLDFIR